MTTQADEVPFLSAMEREPEKDGYHDVTVKVERIGRKVFATDGVAERVQRMVDRLHQKLRAMLSMQGPADYDRTDDDIRLLVKSIDKLTQRGGNHYHEGGDKALLKWILGVLSILTASAIIGGVTLYGKVTSLEATVNAGNARLDRLERLSERR